MSEAEKSIEVEDVLSSIRRLVAQQNEPDSTQPVEAAQKAPVVGATEEPAPFLAAENLELSPQDLIAPVNFADTLSASISKIQDMDMTSDVVPTTEPMPEVESVELVDEIEEVVAEDTEADTHEAQIAAFLETETAQSEDITQQEDIAVAEAFASSPPAEPFVLRPEMVAADEAVNDTQDAEINIITDDDTEEDIDPETFAETAVSQDDADDAEDMVEDTQQFIDEETLREIVGELIRVELQGDLGDRITRNVRKLVRREINQALAAKEFS